MNRPLLLSAVGCLLAFASLYGLLTWAAGIDESPAGPLPGASHATVASSTLMAPMAETERLFGSLCNKYAEQWRAWEESPHRLLSRAAPRPFPPLRIEFALTPPRSSDEHFLLATILLHRGESAQSLPCVVDPAIQQVRLFVDGAWMTGDEWLSATQPAPHDRSSRSGRLPGMAR